jgi:hypothetical protein
MNTNAQLSRRPHRQLTSEERLSHSRIFGIRTVSYLPAGRPVTAGLQQVCAAAHAGHTETLALDGGSKLADNEKVN